MKKRCANELCEFSCFFLATSLPVVHMRLSAPRPYQDEHFFVCCFAYFVEDCIDKGCSCVWKHLAGIWISFFLKEAG